MNKYCFKPIADSSTSESKSRVLKKKGTDSCINRLSGHKNIHSKEIYIITCNV